MKEMKDFEKRLIAEYCQLRNRLGILEYHLSEENADKFKETVEDTRKHITIWPNDPAFSITIADPEPEEEKVTEEDASTDNSVPESGV